MSVCIVLQACECMANTEGLVNVLMKTGRESAVEIIIVIIVATLSIERVPFYRMALFQGIPRPRSTFYRMCKFLERMKHI